jgi:glycosyltransferase involved in cell wall biosynthesis
MACGCPVVISSDPALREVCGDAARVASLSVDKPLQSLREAIEDVLVGKAAARDELIREGLERAKQFTWAQTARLTRETYEKALGS